MPRGAKRDAIMTDWLFAIGLLSDKESFVSIDSDLYLHGTDWEAQKARVWLRDKGKCQLCKKSCYDGIADPDHIVKRSKGGDDSLGNLRTVHRECHEKRHPEKQVRFGEGRQEATEQFSKLYPKGE